MFSIPGIVGLIFFLYARPTDVYKSLQAFKLLHVFIGVALVGTLIDLRLGLLRIVWSPLITRVTYFTVWCVICGFALGGPAEAGAVVGRLVPSLAVFLLMSWGVDGFKGLKRLLTAVFACSMLVTFVCAHQSVQPLTCCVVVDELTSRPDGRACQEPRDCREDAPQPDAEYVCERPGLFGTTSVAQGRVRFTGKLQDPNECALAMGAGTPFLVALIDRKKSLWRYLFAGLCGAATIYAILKTESRGGVFVVLAVIACVAMRGLQYKRLLYAGVLGLPVLLIGGRGGEAAEASTLERLEAWGTGVQLLRTYPLFGVGQGQFSEHHFITAHNAYVLATAEIGLIGGVLWLAILYMSVKTSIVAFFKYRLVPEAHEASRSAFTVGSMVVGCTAGIFFLSFCYHYVLWIHLGLCGGLYNAIKRHDPTFTVTFDRREVAILTTAYVVLLTLIQLYVRHKVG